MPPKFFGGIVTSLLDSEVPGRAGSWSIRALRHESDCGPLAHILKNSGPKVVLVQLHKFSLYRAVRAPIVARALSLQPFQPHGWSGPGYP